MFALLSRTSAFIARQQVALHCLTFLLQFAHQSLTDTGGLLHTVDS